MVDGPYSHHDDLRGLFDRLGSERASFVGCSMGGGALIDFAPRHPRHACALVLVGPAVSGVESDEAPSEEWDELVAADEAGDSPHARRRQPGPPVGDRNACRHVGA